MSGGEPRLSRTGRLPAKSASGNADLQRSLARCTHHMHSQQHPAPRPLQTATHVVSEGAVVGVLLDGHDLDRVVAQLPAVQSRRGAAAAYSGT